MNVSPPPELQNLQHVIIDVQGFKIEENRFIIKEFAITCGNSLQVYLFKPPFAYKYLTEPEKRQVDWIERNRNLYWSDGYVDYSVIRNHIVLALRNKSILTKGSEKIIWLKEMLENNNVYNLEDRGCPNLISLYEKYKHSKNVFSCIYHHSICAQKNVTCLKNWCMDNDIKICNSI